MAADLEIALSGRPAFQVIEPAEEGVRTVFLAYFNKGTLQTAFLIKRIIVRKKI